MQSPPAINIQGQGRGCLDLHYFAQLLREAFFFFLGLVVRKVSVTSDLLHAPKSWISLGNNACCYQPAWHLMKSSFSFVFKSGLSKQHEVISERESSLLLSSAMLLGFKH